ncbi:beta-galactosidase [Bacteroidia bacterium]|nr:beta-galactosidase [Bacteroidia bacterium]
MEENFDFNWKFQLGDEQEAKEVSFDDGAWRTIQLPHDFSLEQGVKEDRRLGSNGFFPGGIGWYRKTFVAPNSYNGKKVYICFDGVYHRSDVWLNGHHLGFRPYGYIGFEYDLTPYLIPGGKNVISVHVDHSNAASSRWYSGSGIYRHVHLKVVDPVHVDQWGVYITTPTITKGAATVRIQTTVKNDDKKTQKVRLLTTLLSTKGVKVGTSTQTIDIAPGSTEVFSKDIEVKQPVLWDLDTPVLYTAITQLSADSNTDEVKTNFGFRTLAWDAQKGFSLNGKSMKLRGVNLHQDGGMAVGAAIPERIWEMRLSRLKEIGVNFIRTSHNPPAPEFMDICDRLGFLVQDEAFDKWKSGYYNEYYDEWWKIDLQSMLQRDKNHPSVILWSVGNEVNEQGKPEGVECLEKMVAFVHEYEPTRKVIAGLYPSNNSDHNMYGFAEKLDIVGLNYHEPYYEIEKKNYPNRIILGTENYLYYRGLAGNDMHFEDAKHTWIDVLEHDWVVGWSLWAGIDYMGETNRFDLKGWPTGFLDDSGYEKPIAGLFRAFWKDSPQLNIAILEDALDIDPGSVNWSSPKMIAHWNFPQYKNRLIRVHTFTNCDSVELWVNKRSMGKRAITDWNNNTIAWTVPYAEGTLKAVGYKGDKEIITKELQTANEPAAISLNNLYPLVKADGQDVALIDITLKDKDGLPVLHDDRMISVKIEGDGTLIGLDNGDLRMKEPIGTNRMSTYFGHCLLVVRANQIAGEINIIVKSEGLPVSSITIQTIKQKNNRKP